jgi:hypothetical protein
MAPLADSYGSPKTAGNGNNGTRRRPIVQGCRAEHGARSGTYRNYTELYQLFQLLTAFVQENLKAKGIRFESAGRSIRCALRMRKNGMGGAPLRRPLF